MAVSLCLVAGVGAAAATGNVSLVPNARCTAAVQWCYQGPADAIASVDTTDPIDRCGGDKSDTLPGNCVDHGYGGLLFNPDPIWRRTSVWRKAKVSAAVAAETILVAGASGRTGALVYKQLQAAGYDVRGLVFNATKARDVLGCTKCDASEGIYEADITKPDAAAFQAAFTGVDRVVLTIGAAGHWKGIPYMSDYVYDHGMPKDLDWLGTRSQPDNFLDKLGNASDTFYKLNAEAYIMAQQVPFTILKICGLTDGDAGKRELLSGHDDEGYNGMLNTEITRADVAALITLSVTNPALAGNLRFDLCSKKGTPTADLEGFLRATKFSWQN